MNPALIDRAFAAGGLLVAAVMGFCPAASAQSTSWWAAETAVTNELRSGERTLEALAEQALAAAPETEAEAMRQLSILTRAGMTERAIEALRQLRQQHPDVHSNSLRLMFMDLVGLQSWDVAIAVVETFEDRLDWSPLSLDPLVQHFLDTGWSAEKVEGWLSDRPPGVADLWSRARARFLVSQQRAAGYYAELEQQVRANPEDAAIAIRYLTIVADNRSTQGDPRPDLGWVVEVCQAPLATDLDRIGARLYWRGEYALAAEFHRRAAEKALTPDEVPEQASPLERVPAAQLRESFHLRCWERVADGLTRSGDEAGARQAAARAAGVRAELGLARAPLPRNNGRPLDERPRNVDHSQAADPAYWREQARRYSAEGNLAGEESCLRTALQFCDPAPGGDHHSSRSARLSDLALFLHREDRSGEAIALLRRELELVPAEPDSAEHAARILRSYFEKAVRFEDEVIWDWLARRKKWTETDRLLLYQMHSNSPEWDRERVIKKAVELTKNAHVSKARELAWEAFQRGYKELAQQLAAYARAGEEDRQSVSLIYFRVSLEQGDWAIAWELYPECAPLLSSRAAVVWLYNISTAAARDGRPQEALQIWKQAAGLDLAAACGVEDGSTLQLLVAAGHKPDLIAYFQDLQRRLTNSDIPPKMLNWLAKE